MRSPEVHKGRGNAWTVEVCEGWLEQEERGRRRRRTGGKKRSEREEGGYPGHFACCWCGQSTSLPAGHWVLALLGGLLRPTDSGVRAPKTSRERAGAAAGPKAVRAVRKRGSGGQEATGRRPAAGGRHDAAPPIGLAGSHSIGFPAWQVGACRTHPSAPSHPPDGDSPKTFGGSSPGPSAGPDFFPCDHDGAISQHQPAPKMPKKYVKLRQALGGSHSVFPRPFG